MYEACQASQPKRRGLEPVRLKIAGIYDQQNCIGAIFSEFLHSPYHSFYLKKVRRLIGKFVTFLD
jgi:hypothetical protein